MSPRIVVLPCDVTKEDQVRQAYKLVEDDLDPCGELLFLFYQVVVDD